MATTRWPLTRWQLVLDYIRENPGKSGPEIWEAVIPECSKDQFQSTMTYLRRDQKLIENRGATRGKAAGRWYVREIPSEEVLPYLAMAQEILAELPKMRKALRAEYLAKRLEAIAR